MTTQLLPRLHSIEVDIPIHIVSEMNTRDHWSARAKRFAAHKEAVHYTLRSLRETVKRIAECDRVLVTVTRFGPRLLDTDNVQSGAKAVRDQVAIELGLSDAPTSPIHWQYQQQQANTYHVSIRIEGINV